ncbi:VIT family protein [Corynebacterium jeddahense]|uniref:VIT family protein n=1 Tax=Corynebacterium jeddahense TaxID=1414719 RepID=A0ABY7UKR0_9CORY|nr:VIT family protein [Corynebacterium jeddahense]
MMGPMTDLLIRPDRPDRCPADCPAAAGSAPAGASARAAAAPPAAAPAAEPRDPGSGERLNRLRAAVLGANDGIVSTAAVVVGVAGATADHTTIAMSGLAAVIGGAVSMALGEYVSVSSQRDSERSLGYAEYEQVNP